MQESTMAVLALYGFSPYSSGLTSAASIVAEQYSKVMITTGAADDDAYRTGNTGLFQLYTPGSLYLASTVDLLKRLQRWSVERS